MFAGKKTFFLNHFLKMRQLKLKKIVSEKTICAVRTIILLRCFGCFVKLIFPMIPFHSVPFQATELTLLWISECLRSLNEHFLPRNNGNRFESIQKLNSYPFLRPELFLFFRELIVKIIPFIVVPLFILVILIGKNTCPHLCPWKAIAVIFKI